MFSVVWFPSVTESQSTVAAPTPAIESATDTFEAFSGDAFVTVIVPETE